MSSRRRDPEHAGQDEQDQPYQGKHRAPESKLRGLGRSLANLVLDQPATAPHPLPDTPGSDKLGHAGGRGGHRGGPGAPPSEVPGDQPAATASNPLVD